MSTATTKVIEVEKSVPVTLDEFHWLGSETLYERGFVHSGLLDQVDYYFLTGVPDRNERLRSETDANGQCVIEYTVKQGKKGAGRTEETTILSREEADGLIAQKTEQCGAVPPWFLKKRSLFTLHFRGYEVKACLDHLIDEEVEFEGYSLEFEILVSEKAEVEAAAEAIGHLVRVIFGEDRPLETRSQQQMCFERRGIVVA